MRLAVAEMQQECGCRRSLCLNRWPPLSRLLRLWFQLVCCLVCLLNWLSAVWLPSLDFGSWSASAAVDPAWWFSAVIWLVEEEGSATGGQCRAQETILFKTLVMILAFDTAVFVFSYCDSVVLCLFVPFFLSLRLTYTSLVWLLLQFNWTKVYQNKYTQNKIYISITHNSFIESLNTYFDIDNPYSLLHTQFTCTYLTTKYSFTIYLYIPFLYTLQISLKDSYKTHNNTQIFK